MIKINNKVRFFSFVFGVIVILILILGVGFYYFAKYQIETPLSSKANSKIFVIQSGEGSEEIAKKLEQENFIRDNFWFDMYVFFKGLDNKLKAGEYALSPSMNIPQIAVKISKGEIELSEIEITIPEGFTIQKIDKRISQKNLIQPGDLKKLTTEDIDFSDLSFKIPNNSLEGYLFPDTYNFDLETEADMIASKMLKNFDKKITKEMRQEIKNQGKTLNEIITMASIIEKEVPSYREQRIVSGIFWKRIDNNYPLQSCATIAYALGEDKWRYSQEDLEVDSPYNTYKNKGLPLSPISNPGISAIKAAIYPQKTNYNFFLSKPNGETVFSATGTEHERKKEKYLK